MDSRDGTGIGLCGCGEVALLGLVASSCLGWISLSLPQLVCLLLMDLARSRSRSRDRRGEERRGESKRKALQRQETFNGRAGDGGMDHGDGDEKGKIPPVGPVPSLLLCYLSLVYNNPLTHTSATCSAHFRQWLPKKLFHDYRFQPCDSKGVFSFFFSQKKNYFLVYYFVK